MKTTTCMLLALLCIAAAGCTSSPRTTAPLGHSVRANMQKQTLNPGTPDLTPPMGIDGNYADAAYKNYLKSAGAKKQQSDQPAAYLLTPGSEADQ